VSRTRESVFPPTNPIERVLSPMRFVMVRGRTPKPQSFCMLCCSPIGERYLRDVGTRLSYCDHRCYLGHSELGKRWRKI
jgi:hypothetical protein